MKRIHLLFMFWIIACQLMAQTAITVHGTVTNIANGTPVVNYPVTIQTDSVNGSYYYHVVFTNPNGFYTDLVPVSQPGTPGVIHVSIYDCQQYLVTYLLTYVAGTTSLEQNFVICATAPPSCVADYSYETTGPLTKHFHDISVNASSQRLWNFGDGTTSTNVDPLHTFPAPGLYPVKLTIGSAGTTCWDSITKMVQVGDSIPAGCQAFYHAEPDNQVPFLFHFINQSSGNPTTFNWDFGDGQTQVVTFPNNPNVSHQYLAPGAFTVCLQILGTDSLCSDIYCSTISVGDTVAPCHASFTYLISGNTGLTVQFTDNSTSSSGAITQWYWIFDDPLSGANNTSNLQNPLHVFGGPGTFNVCLTISNTNGCQSTYCYAIGVGQPQGCHADYTFEPAGPLMIHFHDISIGVNSLRTWYFGDGTTSTNVDPLHTFPAVGVYPVKLMIGAPGTVCWDSITKMIYVGDTLPAGCQAYFHAEQDNQVPLLIHFQNQSTGNLSTFFWNFGDGTSATISFPANPNVNHQYASAGTYTVCLTVQGFDSLCADSYCTQVHVEGTSAQCHAAYTYATAPGTTPDFIQFTDTSISSGPISWIWDFGDPASGLDNFSTLQNPSHVFTSPGIFNVCLTISSNDSLCHDTWCHPVETGQQQACEAHFDAHPAQNSILTMHFEDHSQGDIRTWTWEFGDGASVTVHFPNNPNATHTYQAPGFYNVCLTVQGFDSLCLSTLCKTVAVYDSIPGCQAQFTYYPDSTNTTNSMQFVDLSSGNPNSWFWNFGDPQSGMSNTSTIQNPVHNFVTPGIYYVCLTIHGPSGQSTWCANVEVGPGPNCVNYFTYSSIGLSVHFEGHLPNSNPNAFVWDFGDNQSGIGENIIHTYATPGIYYVTLTTVSPTIQGGCTYTSGQMISVGDSTLWHQLYGQVFAGNFPIQQGIVMLFSMDTINYFVPFVSVSLLDSSGVYFFPMVPQGNFYIYAIPLVNGYLPTYYGDVLNWNDATVITLGTPNNPYDIHLVQGDSYVQGSGSIQGHLAQGDISQSMVDKVTMLLKNEHGKTIQHSPVNAAGDFNFSQLAYGTYYLYAELAGCESQTIKVVLSETTPSIQVGLALSGHSILGTPESLPSIDAGVVYPNPVNDYARIAMKLNNPADLTIELYNMSGQMISQIQKSCLAGETLVTIPTAGLNPGIFTLKIYTSEGLLITRKLVK